MHAQIISVTRRRHKSVATVPEQVVALCAGQVLAAMCDDPRRFRFGTYKATRGDGTMESTARPSIDIAADRPLPGLALLLAVLSVPGSTIAWDLPWGGLWIGLPLGVAS